MDSTDMGILLVLIVAALLLSLAMAGAWLVQQRTGQSGWIDACWSFAVGAAGVLAALLPFTRGMAPITRQWLVAGFVAFWAIRLGSHIAARAGSARHDDPRYAFLREQWGAAFPRRLFLFLQIQALCGLGLAATAFAAAHRPYHGLDIQDAIGGLILIGSVIGEGIADRQLRRFAADPANKGQVCDRGLWRWSRHPNYFFEWLGWLAYPVIAIDVHGYYPLGWLALLGPALIYWMLVYASGIPPLEAHMLRSRGALFERYRARTSAFFPLPPRTA
jgi:steroid 5-alpha reductase family enzyme